MVDQNPTLHAGGAGGGIERNDPNGSVAATARPATMSDSPAAPPVGNRERDEMRKRTILAATAVIALTVAGVAGVATASKSNLPAKQHFANFGPFCISTSNGIMRAVATGQTCHEGEHRIAHKRIPIGPGARGLRGTTGQIGTTGRTGAVGRAGATGSRGAKGAAGAAGKNGLAGTNGVDGKDGVTGAKGETGAGGPVGLKGEAGAGATGSTGLAGLNGLTGAQGTVGLTGEQGLPGLIGPAGHPGPAGEAGATGAPGQNGAPGAAGEIGAPGAPARPCADWRSRPGVGPQGRRVTRRHLALRVLPGPAWPSWWPGVTLGP